MGNKQFPTGVKPHGAGIQIKFKPEGFEDYVYETLPWKATPASLSRAGKLRQQIVEEITHGVFNYAAHFPNSNNVAEITDQGFARYAQVWLDSPIHDWKSRSRYKYRNILTLVWMPYLHNRQIRHITHSDLIDVLTAVTNDFKKRKDRQPSPSLYNDWLTCIRGVFSMAIIDGVIKRADDPAQYLTNKKRCKREIDPFTVEEANGMIEDVYQHDGPMWGAWVELGFYSGIRYPSEPVVLCWPNIDFRLEEFRITQIRIPDGIQLTTKTGVERIIDMNTRSRHAFTVLRELTGFRDNWVFLQDVENNEPVITAKPQRNMFKACLKRLHIRPRPMYNMRHTYATFGLMNGANPAYMARQLGHSIQEFYRTYATWIERADRGMQKGLLDAGIERTQHENIKVGQKWGTEQLKNTKLLNIKGNNGAGNETRTRDPNLGKVVLYQLSYSRVEGVL